MIINFTVQNFYSIGKEVSVSFESRSKASIKYPELYSKENKVHRNLSRINFIGGKNGSGKTNILRVLAFVKHMVTNTKEDDEEVPYMPFASHSRKNSKISVEFAIPDDMVYIYTLEFTRRQIISEVLEKKYYKEKQKTKAQIFSRKWNDDAQRYVIDYSATDAPLVGMILQKDLMQKNKTKTAIAIFRVFDEDTGVFNKIYNYWRHVLSNVMQIGSTESEGSFTTVSANELKRLYDKPNLRRAADALLRRYDIGVDRINKKENVGPNHETVYGLEHKYSSGDSFGMTMHLESTGTKRLTMLIYTIIASLAVGGVAVIDELDAFLHPDIYNDILEMFISSNINRHGAQLIFSTQNYSVLGRLDKQQVHLSDKDDHGQTETWRLDDMKGIRPDDNFYSKYMTGAYGGTPKTETVLGDALNAILAVSEEDI